MLGTWVICAKGEGVGMCVLLLCALCACWLGQSVVCEQLWPGYGGLCCSSKRTPGWLPPGSAAGWCGLRLSRLGDPRCYRGSCMCTCCQRVSPFCVRVCSVRICTGGPREPSGGPECCVSLDVFLCIDAAAAFCMLCVWILTPQVPCPSPGLPSKGPRPLSLAAPEQGVQYCSQIPLPQKPLIEARFFVGRPSISVCQSLGGGAVAALAPQPWVLGYLDLRGRFVSPAYS